MASEPATAEGHPVAARREGVAARPVSVAAQREGVAARPEKGAVRRESCCSAYHQAIELIGKRWTGAILFVLMDGPLRFSEVKLLVPDLSDRLLSERMKELEGEGIVERRVINEVPIRVEYTLTDKGRALEPAVRSLKVWARSWL
ncbi:MAG: winged helix-turn-helix transcriptional regulator [Thermoleophilaceae bacterium]